MSNYIGNQPSFGEFKKLDSIVSLFNGSTTQFNLEHNSVANTVGDATQLIVSLNGVIQEPGTAYTLGLGGGSIVFASAPASTDTCHIVSLGGVGSTGTVADGSISAVKLASNLRDLLEEEFTGDGSTTTFTMARSVSYSNQLLVTISGVVQPTSAYSVSGTTLTISPALPNTTNIRILHIGIPGAFNSANSILPSMLSSTGGTANQVLAVNAGATGIEFQTVSSGGGIALTDLSVSVGSAGSSTLAYNNTTGAFAYTPPDLSSYLTSVSASNLNSISIDALSDVDTTTASPSSGEVLKWNGSNWAPATDSTSSGGSGSTGQTITSITANTTLSNSDKGKLIQTETSGITITIPALSSLDADWFVDIETLNTNTFNHGKVTLDITTNNSGASINRGGNETMYGASKIRLQRSPAGGDSQGQLSAFASNYLTGGIIVREDRLAGGLQGGDVGVGSIMLGNAQDASGNDAIAIGQLGSASATGSVAIGSYNGSSATTVAAATGAVAIGSGRAGGNQSLALQIQNSGTSYGATSTDGIAIGDRAKAGSGGQSVAIGQMSIASGTSACAISGYYAQATGSGSLALGLYSNAQGNNSISIGYRSYANTEGKVAIAAGETSGISSGAGYQQRGTYILKGATTDATQKVLTGQGGTASTSNSWIPSNNSAHAFSGTVIARQDGTDGDNYAAWEVKGAVMKADNAASMVVGAAIINSLYHTSGASAWAVTIAANTTLGSAEVKVTGASSTNISWVTTIDTSEVVNP